MISLCESLPEISVLSVEYLKIRCLYEAYKDDGRVLFWRQRGNNSVISLADGNMIIYSDNADTDEIKEFVNILSPLSVMSDYSTLCKIGKKPPEKLNVMWRPADIKGDTKGDELSSREIYDLLNVPELTLPDYPSFAVDYCRRLNMGNADYFGITGKCAAVTFNCGKTAVLNGIASKEKGYGSKALTAVLEKNYSRDFFVCCKDSVKSFYEKNGFKTLYYGGCWVKTDEC